jgi:WD40 repeat protein
VKAVVMTPDGKRAVSASDDGTLKVWDLKSGAVLRHLTGHTNGVNAVAVTPDGKRAVSASDDRTLRMWDLETGAALLSFTADGSMTCVLFATPSRVFAGGSSGEVHLLAVEEP